MLINLFHRDEFATFVDSLSYEQARNLLVAMIRALNPELSVHDAYIQVLQRKPREDLIKFMKRVAELDSLNQ